MKVILGITGATGASIGVRILQSLRELNVETHLILTKWGRITIKQETDYDPQDIIKMASIYYNEYDLSAPIASGSFLTDAMVIAPCSMKTLSAVSHGYSESLITRAADIMLKERRRLILMPRETPLNAIHLQNMLTLTHAGAIMLPPMPAFYNNPSSISDLVDLLASKTLDLLGLDNNLARRWEGIKSQHSTSR